MHDTTHLRSPPSLSCNWLSGKLGAFAHSKGPSGRTSSKVRSLCPLSTPRLSGMALGKLLS